MSSVSPAIQDLSRRLLASGAESGTLSDPQLDVTVQIIVDFRTTLVRLAGIEGFRSLLSRALTLARADDSSLDSVQVKSDGSLAGFDGIEQRHGSEATREAGIVLVAHLMELLVVFIGEPLTLNLARDTWPHVSI